MQLAVSGTFANNVRAIVYAGFKSTRATNCASSTSISPASLGSFVYYPPVTLRNNFGNNGGIIYTTSCVTNVQTGGGNTADQILDYYQTYFSSRYSTAKTDIRLYKFVVQYNCWSASTTYRLSTLGCCTGV